MVNVPTSSTRNSAASARRPFDIAVAACALAVLAPLILLLVVLIKVTSRGPAFFVQSRRGKDGRPFDIWKLRTLRPSPELEPDRIGEQANSAINRRVLWLGRLLRNRGLDEIPQFWNVLRGDMSIIGPRPHALAHDAECLSQLPTYHQRFAVKPGITGWAQVNGSRGPLTSLLEAEQRLRLDLFYIHNRSAMLDLMILSRTVGILLFGAGKPAAIQPESHLVAVSEKSAGALSK